MSRQKYVHPKDSIDSLIYSLKHHAPDNPDPNSYVASKNPFEDINVLEELSRCQILDYDSDPDSDAEDALYETQWADADQEFSELQSIDHEMEYGEVLERAGVYTADEVLKISVEKNLKLHAIYCSQLNELRQTYIDKKRQYLQDLKKEKELYCSIHDQKKTSLDEIRKYKQLKALISYGRKHGLDAILAKRQHQKRMANTSRAPSKSQKTYKCHFQDDGVRCFSTCLPLTKYCMRHILEDKRQVLFRPCNTPFNNTTCTNPVLNGLKDEVCVFHSSYKKILEREGEEAAQEIEKQRIVAEEKIKKENLKKEEEEKIKKEEEDEKARLEDDAKKEEEIKVAMEEVDNIVEIE